METMGNLRRTNYCGEVSLADAGKEMTVCGSIARARDKGGIIFADLRDTTGILQLVFDDGTDRAVFEKAGSLKSEYVIIAKGTLRERDAKTDKIATGDVEEMEEIGYDDYFFGSGVCLIEWAELIEELIPGQAVRIMIEKDVEKGFDYRKITIEGMEEL